ncbi:RNA-binding S4 domain-containing protein [Caldimonas thermodepolymerans]|jgi:ribosome-associated protein|uniref:RNA-binding protein n=1 Tax=Caldimonas thermodepolymerans TaxID=215580 RepID=A0A2S5T9K0_9BURK|nr:RNA-binding S4 domain-containing protein [Caldimonas thermodepolymerans]PPE71537.1 RNA-binding protein [Caldimonas thermodepolymerans]QPC30563.1 RNA-binding S4 domain-containing protein [Caldimonas thermodepolymerans]RDI02842.1 ribosome-associated protein [Caldimonas thermodepolymerans]TCP08628.1 ribosome-associated protein [Caldimonas thermodepolymerans]UZG43289.1 RNA-binding S4 domain-containing protein [Caldimonas thermodepolymerans]
MRIIDFELRGEFITLDRLLKATGLADSGGEAKAAVAAGKVQVDGRDELRKTCKIRAGQVVQVHGARVRVHAPPAGAPGDAHDDGASG